MQPCLIAESEHCGPGLRPEMGTELQSESEIGRRTRARQDVVSVVAVVVTVLLCVIAAAAAIVTPLAPALGSSSSSLCHNVTEPDEVYADHGEASEGTAPEMHLSIVPYGPACTWILSDGRSVTRDPGVGIDGGRRRRQARRAATAVVGASC